MKSSRKLTAWALGMLSATLTFAQGTPPWNKGANDPAQEKGYAFCVADIDNVPDIHGDPCDAKLVIFIGGNQFFVLPQRIAAFEEQHPYNMPQNHPGTLSAQDAYDVSEFIHTMPRPKFNEAYKNY